MVLTDGKGGMGSLSIILYSLPFTSIGAMSPCECGDGVPIRVRVESTRSLVETSTTMAFVGSRSRIVVSLLMIILMSARALLMGSRVTVVLSALVGMVLIPVLGVPIVGVLLSMRTRLVMTSGIRCCVVPIGGDITSN